MEHIRPPALLSLVSEEKVRKFAEDFGMLADRWKAERGYEDFAEYKKAAARMFGAEVLQMTAKPFKVVFRVGGCYAAYFETKRSKVEFGMLGIRL